MHGLRQMYHRLRNVLDAPDGTPKRWAMWNLVSVRLETVFVGVQDRCTVCTKHAIITEINLDAPMILQGDETQVEAQFGLFGDSANLEVR